MKKRIQNHILILLIISFQASAQTTLSPGYPDRSPSFDVLPGFVNPPKGYGEVPFYWWQGDTLTHERLKWQLNQLKNKGISSLQINYSHLDSGGLTYGLSNPSKPALFSDEWWNLFKWFAAEAHKQDMTVSLSDYTLGIGQGFSMDEALQHNPDINGSILKQFTIILSGKVDHVMPDNLLSLTAFQIKEDSSLIIETRKDLLPWIKNGSLVYNFRKEPWKIIAVFSEKLIPSYDPMHPESGKAYNQYFFEKFERALPEVESGELNFFFSDELNFRVNGNLWNSRFAEEFRKRKGYDLTPYLDALYVNIGSITPKIRLDYNDVIVSLSEENFFKPVYLWHQDRGLIFGCDHGGRGRDVAEFGDYFRTQRWNQGPGSDQPMLSKDIIKAKVAASISHLYERPRVWLEGFHSSGWGTSSADICDAVFANFVAGYNLLSFHGLYYSTMGGWWEWAPPDNHFRMPYWNQIGPFMNCVERLSFLLSQGYHSCDVAIIYPTEPVVAGMEGNESVKIAFETGEQLYKKGIDFDFIDFESLARSEVQNKELIVSGEKYKVLVVPSMRAIRYSSLKKIEEFKTGGGIIVNIGKVPEATEKESIGDKEITNMVIKVFSGDHNLFQCKDAESVPELISGKYKPNFKILTEIKEAPYVMHRIVGKRQVYALYNIPSGTSCFFNAKGNVQLWNPWNGDISSLKNFTTETTDGTEIALPLSSKEIHLIIFDPEETDSIKVFENKQLIKEIVLNNTWEFELKPSLDNKWGDFQLPASNELLGAQIRQIYLNEEKEYAGGELSPEKTWKRVTCGYGPQFLKLGAISDLPTEKELSEIYRPQKGNESIIGGKKYKWEEYSFSWQKGVEGDYGHQGYHGLKGNMYDDFIRLGAMQELKMSKKRVTENAGNYYILYTSVIAPEDGSYDLLSGDVKPYALIINSKVIDPSSGTITLKKGPNPILIVYNHACESYLVFRQPTIRRPEKQPISMCWYKDTGVLPFDYSSDKNTSGLFAFNSAPGMETFSFSAYGKVTTWIDGKAADIIQFDRQTDGLTKYTVNSKQHNKNSSEVIIKIVYQPGFSGAGAIPQYINQQCGKGIIIIGDWSEIDGLKSYSGGAWYRKTINLDKKELQNKIEIDLGNLVSSAELFINGSSAGTKVAPPWTFDITDLAKAGENSIDILIYNTLANNYVAVPTRYKGNIKSGLTGPVTIKFYESIINE